MLAIASPVVMGIHSNTQNAFTWSTRENILGIRWLLTSYTLTCYDLCLFCYRSVRKKIHTSFLDAHQGLALYMCQILILGLNTFSFTCAVRYFKPLIINPVTELTLLCFDLCFLCYWKVMTKIQASFLMHIKVWHCIGVKPWWEA